MAHTLLSGTRPRWSAYSDKLEGYTSCETCTSVVTIGGCQQHYLLKEPIQTVRIHSPLRAQLSLNVETVPLFPRLMEPDTVSLRWQVLVFLYLPQFLTSVPLTFEPLTRFLHSVEFSILTRSYFVHFTKRSLTKFIEYLKTLFKIGDRRLGIVVRAGELCVCVCARVCAL